MECAACRREQGQLADIIARLERIERTLYGGAPAGAAAAAAPRTASAVHGVIAVLVGLRGGERFRAEIGVDTVLEWLRARYPRAEFREITFSDTTPYERTLWVAPYEGCRSPMDDVVARELECRRGRVHVLLYTMLLAKSWYDVMTFGRVPQKTLIKRTGIRPDAPVSGIVLDGDKLDEFMRD